MAIITKFNIKELKKIKEDTTRRKDKTIEIIIEGVIKEEDEDEAGTKTTKVGVVTTRTTRRSKLIDMIKITSQYTIQISKAQVEIGTKIRRKVGRTNSKLM